VRWNGLGETVPSHIAGPVDDGGDRIEHGAIPELFECGPTALNRIIFTVIWRIVNESNSQTGSLGKFHHPLDKLGAITAIRGSAIQVNH
jgi:hypothetical protein